MNDTEAKLKVLKDCQVGFTTFPALRNFRPGHKNGVKISNKLKWWQLNNPIASFPMHISQSNQHLFTGKRFYCCSDTYRKVWGRFWGSLGLELPFTNQNVHEWTPGDLRAGLGEWRAT